MNPLQTVRDRFREAFGTGFGLTPGEQTAALVVLSLFTLGVLVRLLRWWILGE